MQKHIILFLTILLAGCGIAVDKKFRQSMVYTAPPPSTWTSIKSSLPKFNVPDEFDFLGEHFTQERSFDRTGSGTTNAQRGYIYKSSKTKNTIFIMDEMSISERDAQELFLINVKLRGDSSRKYHIFDHSFYQFGVDKKLGWPYIVMSTYDDKTEMLRTKIFLMDLQVNENKYEQIGLQEILKQLNILGK